MSWHQILQYKFKAQKSPQGLRHAGFRLLRSTLESPLKDFGGLAESDKLSQPIVIYCFILIQVLIVYLSVYQLPWLGWFFETSC